MKIVHLCLNGPVTDGWNYQDNLLTKYHKRLGYDVTIITSRWIWNTDGQLKLDARTDYFNGDGVRVIRLSVKGHDDCRKKFKKYVGLWETIKQMNPDILFLHGLSCVDNRTIAKYLKKNRNVICYVDNHADFCNSGSNWLSKNILHKIIWRHYAKMLCPYVKKFYGVLPARIDFLIDVYGIPKEKCALLVMGADDELVDQAFNGSSHKIRDIYGIRKSDFLIVSGGKINSFRPEVLNLMAAVNELNDRPEERSIWLLIFGSVSHEWEEQFERLSAHSQIIYVGWVESGATYQYLAAADLVVFPGLHSVMWEQAVALGKPCVFKDMEGFHHVDIGGNARFLKDTSKDSLYKELLAVIHNGKLYEEMKICALQPARERFLYSKIAKESIEVL